MLLQLTYKAIIRTTVAWRIGMAGLSLGTIQWWNIANPSFIYIETCIDKWFGCPSCALYCQLMYPKEKCAPSSIVITEVSLFGCVICSSAVYIDWRIDNIAKWANTANIQTVEMEFSSLDGGENGEHDGAGFGEIARILICNAGCNFLCNRLIRQSWPPLQWAWTFRHVDKQ